MVLAHNIEDGIRTRDIQISQDVTFNTMLLAPNTLQGLKNAGFYKPSPVQLHGIPMGKCGFDLLLEAKSGTGKTAVFSVIALEKLDVEKGLQVVILAPTREIASQICDVIKQIGENYNGLVVEVVMGGLPVPEDIAKFKNNVHIVVGSPGRLRHLIQDKHIDVNSVRLFVLDEADKLMEKSFLPDINYIFSVLPNQKQVIMSSATYPEDTRTFINKYVKCAQHVCPDSNCVLLGVEQKKTVVSSHTNIVRQTQYRFEELLKILSHRQFKQCLVFCNYQARVHELYKLLNREKWPVEQLCGQQDQSDRLDALKTLQEYKCRILISTDLAARGIDASNVDLVINFEPPYDWQTYLHRIGRAGRYGSYGMAITILGDGKEESRFIRMLKLINWDAISIKDLWKSYKTDENNRDEIQSDISPTNNIVSNRFEDEYKDFWETLVSVKDAEEVDDFEVLCKSFEQSKLPESFTSLINSYETDNNTHEEDSPYRYMGVNSKPIKHLFSCMKVSNNNNANIKNDNIKPNTDDVVRDKNFNDIRSLTHIGQKVRLEDEPLIKQENTETLQNNNFENTDQIVNNCDEDEEFSNRALLEAGLPLSFGSSKGKSSCKGKVKSSKEETFRNVKSKTLNHNYEENQTNNVRGIKNKGTYRQVDQYFKEEGNYKVDKYKTNHRNKKYECNSTQRKDFTETRMISENYDYSEDYINWYRQLKSSVKHYELAVYIHEMSKM